MSDLNDAERAARANKALELHLAGASYQSIADACGFASKSSAFEAVKAALAEQAANPDRAEAVRVEVARLDAMLTGLWAKARRGDVAAVDRVLKIGERRTQLLSLAAGPAPAEHDTTTTTGGEGASVADIAKRRADRLAAADRSRGS